MLKYFCDVCGKESSTAVPTWTTLMINISGPGQPFGRDVPNPPTPAPVMSQVTMYVCDDHKISDIPKILGNALMNNG